MSLEDIKIDEKIEIEIKEPPQCKVVFLNDDSTPMEFVVEMLVGIFKHTFEIATDLTIQIHEEGSGVAGIYSYEIAEQKATETVNLARTNGFALKVKIEEDT
jgi:ATP-dependent Clp protease adaptor protein ClpS|tara:strand:- start:1393 stop:1698 length:306 start_codon:yes stop_codon:yes gene_type:complete